MAGGQERESAPSIMPRRCSRLNNGKDFRNWSRTSASRVSSLPVAA